jgi:hypothetical protein
MISVGRALTEQSHKETLPGGGGRQGLGLHFAVEFLAAGLKRHVPPEGVRDQFGAFRPDDRDLAPRDANDCDGSGLRQELRDAGVLAVEHLLADRMAFLAAEGQVPARDQGVRLAAAEAGFPGRFWTSWTPQVPRR